MHNTIYYAPDKEKKWKAYIRINDQNIMANNILLQVWKRQQKKRGTYIKYSNKEKILFDYLKTNQRITVSKFCRIAKISRADATKTLINLILFHIVEIVFTDTLTYYQLSPDNKQEKNRQSYFAYDPVKK